MTLPYEEQRSLKLAREFIYSLLSIKKVPKYIKQQALVVLRHYPMDYRIDEFYMKV